MSAKLDLTGQRFGRLIVVKDTGKKQGTTYLWECLCDCGNTCITRVSSLRNGTARSCGCLQRDITAKLGKASCGIKRKPLSKVTKQKISKALTGKYTGLLSSQWNPNLTNEEREVNRDYFEYDKWRKAVYNKDNFTCQKCKQKSGYLNAHHIESFDNNPELRIEISNGITLCENCHKNFHHQCGYGNNTKDQLKKFMKRK